MDRIRCPYCESQVKIKKGRIEPHVLVDTGEMCEGSDFPVDMKVVIEFHNSLWDGDKG